MGGGYSAGFQPNGYYSEATNNNVPAGISGPPGLSQGETVTQSDFEFLSGILQQN